MRILIIEDDKSLAETLRFQLERNHFETDICHDGEEGLHFIEQQSHDLILLDRMLPGPGWNFCIENYPGKEYFHAHYFCHSAGRPERQNHRLRLRGG